MNFVIYKKLLIVLNFYKMFQVLQNKVKIQKLSNKVKQIELKKLQKMKV